MKVPLPAMQVLQADEFRPKQVSPPPANAALRRPLKKARFKKRGTLPPSLWPLVISHKKNYNEETYRVLINLTIYI